eukprot:gene32029-40473_t
MTLGSLKHDRWIFAVNYSLASPLISLLRGGHGAAPKQAENKFDLMLRGILADEGSAPAAGQSQPPPRPAAPAQAETAGAGKAGKGKGGKAKAERAGRGAKGQHLPFGEVVRRITELLQQEHDGLLVPLENSG